ncbi:hypothetical protein DBQ68_12325 [Lactobacillus sp. DS15_6]|nr:hypothetical protein FAM18149p_14145 [Lacticaseibacillus paracasei]PTS48785.1 hypothetical protein DBQ62_12255 [Lactobacillus sp. DS9_6]PTS60555.1 hypothetical protein DBQ68_12325 [Lactobacillus sp. DS15_6]PTS69463.1 hypothetical protein DBQ65_11840 [Lactobacillus sp. DS3_6]PTV38961.1 hypothetical protein DB343_12350 [Lactobacillus sp. DS18_6]
MAIAGHNEVHDNLVEKGMGLNAGAMGENNGVINIGQVCECNVGSNRENRGFGDAIGASCLFCLEKYCYIS